MPKLRLLPPITTVYSEQQAADALAYLMRRGGRIAIDSETTGLDKLRARIICWSMATEDRRYFIPSRYIHFFHPLFRRPDITWIFANAKFDMHMFANMGAEFVGKIWDIVVMDAMDDDTRSHGLKEQSLLAYDVRWGDFKELFLDPAYVSKVLNLDPKAFTQFKKLSVGERLNFVYDERPDIVENYASCDAYFTYVRATDLEDNLAATSLPMDMVPGFTTLLDYYTVIEVPFTKVLWDMERLGVPVDLDYVKSIDGPMRDGIRALEKDLREIAGPTFNPSSRDELRDILFSKQGFGLKPVKYTTKGANPLPSTAEDDLETMKGRIKEADRKAYNFIDMYLKYTTLKKNHGTYVEKINKHLGPDGRIHCRYNQAGTRTGRLSASDPNLQNIPAPESDKFKIRGLFVAPPGEKMLDFDYPQIQPRLAAIFAEEKDMLDAISKGWDIHSANAANMYKHKNPLATYERINEVKKIKDTKSRPLTPEELELALYRSGAKTVGLGVMFGEGPTKMGHQIGVSTDEAKGMMRAFFDAYPRIEKLIHDMHDYGHENEFTYTMLGRIRRLHRINNPYNNGIVAAEERIAFNTLIQGSEVELLKCAMLQLAHNDDFKTLGGKMALTVHDELMSFAPDDTADEVYMIQEAIMANPLHWGPIHIDLPISVAPDGGKGHRWTEVH